MPNVIMKKTLASDPAQYNRKFRMVWKSMDIFPARFDHTHDLYPANNTPSTESVPTAIWKSRRNLISVIQYTTLNVG